MTDTDPTRQTEHEERVADEMTEERAEEAGMPGTAEAETGATPYQKEVEAERRGTTADEVELDEAEDEKTALDAGYKVRTG